MWCILVRWSGFPSYATSKLNAKGASHFLRLGVIDSRCSTENYQSRNGKYELSKCEDLIRHAESQVKTSHRGPANLLKQIKTDAEAVFTYQDAVNMRLANSKDEEGTSGMLNQWVKRGHIERLEDGRFRILDKNDR